MLRATSHTIRPTPGAALVLIVTLAASASAQTGSPNRRAAIDRALAFLQTTASNDANVAKYGSDLLWCFSSISHTAKNRELRESAARMGRELAERWRRSHQHVPADAGAHDIFLMVTGAYAADRLGFPDPKFKTELLEAAQRFSARDYLGFDAAREPPRADDPERYDKWSGALITTFFGDAYGVRLGASYHDVLQWLARFRPFDGHDDATEFDAFYAVTHVIYTMNGYHEHRVAPSLLTEEFAFIRRKLDKAINDDDPEMVAESLDCLKAGGLEDDPLVRKGMDYLLSSQRSDGAWTGDQDDVYTEYHSAWAGIDGLRDYRFHSRIKGIPAKLNQELALSK